MKALFKFFIVLFFLLLCRTGYTQSTLEYAALLSGQSAVSSIKKGKGPVPQGVDSAGVLSKGSALLRQAGSSFDATGTSPDQEKQAAPGEAKVGMPKVLEIETKPSAPEGENDIVKVYLKSGQVIEGKLVERGDDHVKVDCVGVAVTYFNEEIDKVV